jgi:2-polyprenyl-6-methoxyphenol hydroxylase-like FAD-dependent oxidoreductase
MDQAEEMEEIIVVGGGICGLATALALHRFLLLIYYFLPIKVKQLINPFQCCFFMACELLRKGIKSLVLEKSESLRATGAGITIRTNGWRALDQLGVGSKLRKTAIHLQRYILSSRK